MSANHTRQLSAWCGACPLVPVIEIDRAEDAVALANALMAGGIVMLEVTLRTPAALAAISAIAKIPNAVVGAGTLLTPEQVDAAKAAGAVFGVSPGATGRLLDASAAADLPLLPGASTVSEMMSLSERGFEILKFFPAEASGGAPALKSVAGPMPHLRFCPTGGVTRAKMAEYLSLPNVICTGASWLSPKDRIASGDFAAITETARGALAEAQSS